LKKLSRKTKPLPRGREGVTTPTAPKRGRGQPAKEPTQQIRAYAADVPRLAAHGKTQAAAVRALLRAEEAARSDG
jgi:hypothetical protein